MRRFFLLGALAAAAPLVFASSVEARPKPSTLPTFTGGFNGTTVSPQPAAPPLVTIAPSLYNAGGAAGNVSLQRTSAPTTLSTSKPATTTTKTTTIKKP